MIAVGARTGAHTIKVTHLESPLPGCDMFSGNATGDDGKLYCFYYTPRRRFAVMKQDAGVPTAWFYCDPPDGMKEAVQTAIKTQRLQPAARSSSRNLNR